MKQRIILPICIVGVVVLLVCFSLLRRTKVDVYHSVRYWGLNRIKVVLWAKPDFVNSVDSCGNTPLHIAANGCTVDDLALFVAKGASINARNNLGRTPLYGA